LVELVFPFHLSAAPASEALAILLNINWKSTSSDFQ
jgi:hypothetical protein